MSFHPTTRTDIYGAPAVSGAFTWNKFLLAKWIDIFIIGAGGGGASGAILAAGGTNAATNCGQGGCIAYYSFPAAMLGLTVAVQVGAGGLGGINVGAGSINGGQGGTSSFGNLVVLGGFGNGLGNSSNLSMYRANTSGGLSPSRALDGGSGGNSGATAANIAAAIAAAGGGGGGAVAAGVPAVGNIGGAVGQASVNGRVVSLAGGAGGALGTTGSPGNSDAVGSVSVFGGSGGGGGGSSVIIAVPGGNGGAGGWPGGGGGGAGSCVVPATVPGVGGAGANGFVLVITHF